MALVDKPSEGNISLLEQLTFLTQTNLRLFDH